MNVEFDKEDEYYLVIRGVENMEELKMNKLIYIGSLGLLRESLLCNIVMKSSLIKLPFIIYDYDEMKKKLF